SVLADPGADHPRSGFVRLRNLPVFLSIAPIRATGLEGGPKGARPFASLIYFMNFDPGVLSGLTKNFNLVDARIVPAAAAGIRLPGLPGVPVDLGLQWQKRVASQD